MKKILSLVLILILSTGFFTSCKKDKGAPPVLPPQESMTIDFTNFSSTKKSAEIISGQKGTSTDNWNYAATVAGVWKLIINTTLAVPVTAFKAALDKTPVFISTKTWQWSYNVTFLNIVYKARLTGLIRSSDVQWKMYITNEATDGFAEFLWFEGTSRLDGTGGQWILYESAQAPDALLQIDWTRSGTTMGTVKYTYMRTLDDNHVADPLKTSNIEYGKISGSYDAYYTIYYYNGLTFYDVNVKWNTTTYNGRIQSSDYLLGDWYCWDGN